MFPTIAYRKGAGIVKGSVGGTSCAAPVVMISRRSFLRSAAFSLREAEETRKSGRDFGFWMKRAEEMRMSDGRADPARSAVTRVLQHTPGLAGSSWRRMKWAARAERVLPGVTEELQRFLNASF